MAPHSSILAWKIPWTEEPGRRQSMESHRVGHDWATSLSLFTFHFHALEKEMATHSSVLAWRIPGTGKPGGLLSMGSHRVGHDWSDLADSILKSRDITLPTRVCIGKAMVFPVVMPGCESWTIKKGEHQRINAFKCVEEDSWESLGLYWDQTNQS